MATKTCSTSLGNRGNRNNWHAVYGHKNLLYLSGNRGNRNNWDVYGHKNLLFCHHLQSYTGCFSYNSLAYSSHCFIVYIC
jgi:hypothetical protein